MNRIVIDAWAVNKRGLAGPRMMCAGEPTNAARRRRARTGSPSDRPAIHSCSASIAARSETEVPATGFGPKMLLGHNTF